MNKKEIRETDSGLFCKLTGEALKQRKILLKNEIFNAVRRTEELENGFRFEFFENEGLDVKLMEFIAAERNCCPFFEISLELLPFGKGINLEIKGQAGVKEFIKTEMLA